MKTATILAMALVTGTVSVAAELATGSITDRYGDAAQKLIAAALADPNSTDRLEYLCDRIGNRVSGSESLERAVEWAAAEMRKAGLENVRTPPVKVPRWVRGMESATMVEPIQKRLAMIGFGMSVGTPPDGLTGNVVAVSDLEELVALGSEKVAGKMVLVTPQPTSKTIAAAPFRAAALGAIAVLIQNGHTRGLEYEDHPPTIPAAVISMEDALMMQRLLRKGTRVRVHLAMQDHHEPESVSHNVIGELRGREKPEEVVVLGGHLDSWDIGQGAQDDGSGVMGALEAVLLIKKLGLQPRRTIRVVFWVNEENGGAGGRAYRALAGDAVKDHVAAIEDDRGAEKPIGYGFGIADQDKLTPGAFRRAVEIGALLKSIGAGTITPRGGGGDIRPLTAEGVPGFGMKTVDLRYSDWNHTNADSFDKIVPLEFEMHVASLAVLSYVLADMPERLRDLR
jgi:carboxypeptidase Q